MSGGIPLNLLTNYLKDRTQLTEFNKMHSDFLSLKNGVSQGSILGPLLFIIYLNDLVNCCNHFKPTIYADDTVLHATSQLFGNSADLINSELTGNTWFKVINFH